MTSIVAALTALMTLDETVDVLPDRFTPFVLGAIAVLTVILGWVAHNKSTALAAPKASTGVPLAPVDGTIDPAAVNPAVMPPRIND
jgi:hypothetical protein